MEIVMLFPKRLPIFEDSSRSDDDCWLAKAGDEALKYIRGFRWVSEITSAVLEFGVPGIIAVSDFEIESPFPDVDTQLWVVTGDVPAAYFVKDDAPDVSSALTVYCELMENWCNHVLCGSDLKDVFPVSAIPSMGNAHDLKRRISFVRDKVIPSIPNLSGS